MSEESTKTTIRFEAYDNGKTQDESDGTISTILSAGPVIVYKAVKTVDDLYSMVDPESTSYDSEMPDDAVVLVQDTTNNPVGSIEYRGVYYKYFPNDDGTIGYWKEVLLGTHTHENKDMLDQIGNIDKENLPNGTKKVLTISAIDEDDGMTASYDLQYNLKWSDLPQGLPSIENVKNEINNGNTYYLSATADGQGEWSNKLIPTQTFQYKQLIIVTKPLADENFINQGTTNQISFTRDENGEPIPPDGYYWSGNEVKFKNVYYDSRIDQILLFSGSYFISDFSTDHILLDNNIAMKDSDGKNIIYCDNETLTITAATRDPDGDNQVFDPNETVFMMILRHGAAGILDTVKQVYLTKEDAVRILTGNSITLRNYATKDDLVEKANKQHQHSQYALKEHNHDDRYADFYHTHSEYMTKAQVLEQITNYLNANDIQPLLERLQAAIDSLDTTGLLNEIIKNVDTKLSEYKSDIDADLVTVQNVTKTQSQNIAKIDIRVSKNENDIQTISDQLTALLAKKTVYSSNVILDSENMEVKSSIGGYEIGDKINKNATLTQFITKLVKVRERLELVYPILTITSNYDSYEYGKIYKPVFGYKFNKHGKNGYITLNNEELTLPSGVLAEDVKKMTNEELEDKLNIANSFENHEVILITSSTSQTPDYTPKHFYRLDERYSAGTTDSDGIISNDSRYFTATDISAIVCGDLQSIKIYYNENTYSWNISESLLYQSFPPIIFSSEDETKTIRFEAFYSKGTTKVDNYATIYGVPEGSVSYNYVISAEKFFFIGGISKCDEITSDIIRDSTVKNVTEKTMDKISDNILEYTYSLTAENNFRNFIIAVPQGSDFSLDSVIYKQQNIEIMDLMDYSNDFIMLYSNQYISNSETNNTKAEMPYFLYNFKGEKNFPKKMTFVCRFRREE